MKERPILFNGAMVRALLDGSKTHTRRVVKPAPQMVTDRRTEPWAGEPSALMRLLEQSGKRCPYGQPGDRLWVREAWARTTVAGQKWVVYREGDNRTDYGGPWKPSIHMFRKDSRITLEIVSVRVERLHDISEADAEAEGVDFLRRVPDVDETLTAKQLYGTLWDSINGAGSWDANPWVWVIEFKKVTT